MNGNGHAGMFCRKISGTIFLRMSQKEIYSADFVHKIEERRNVLNDHHFSLCPRKNSSVDVGFLPGFCTFFINNNPFPQAIVSLSSMIVPG